MTKEIPWEFRTSTNGLGLPDDVLVDAFGEPVPSKPVVAKPRKLKANFTLESSSEVIKAFTDKVDEGEITEEMIRESTVDLESAIRQQQEQKIVEAQLQQLAEDG